jgi:hypothetical protein
VVCYCLLLSFGTRTAPAQDRGSARLHALVEGLTVTPRVLLIGARPTDADADLIAWLARGHHVETGFLSLTRGESAPNYTGFETGAALGAIHVQELLAARRIDGGEQYFTRAYDFGGARNAANAFEHWDRAELLGDVVAIVRAFRPHVIVALAATDTLDHDGQRQVSAIIARDVFDAALDTVRFPSAKFGMPWSSQSLFAPGAGIAINSRDYDRMTGRTYADMASDSRAQLRSFGFATVPWQSSSTTQWRRIATRVVDTTAGASSIFAGIDTAFVRLQRDLPQETTRGGSRTLLTQLPAMLAYADSARTALDLSRPASAVPHLQRVVELASSARVLLRGCRHPARDAAASFSNTKCQPQWLDLDASLDLVLRRAGDALLAATGVTIEATSDREFLASMDSARVTVTVVNNSDSTISVNDVSVTNAVPVRMTEPVRIPPHQRAQVERTVTSLAYAHPWWIFKRTKNFYPNTITGLDGVPRPAVFMRDFGISSIAIPDDIRRLSDVTATITMGMTTLTSSVGTVVFKTAEPALGAQDRAVSGVPAVTLGFERALEWAQAGKPMKKQLRAVLRSFSDLPQTFALKESAPASLVKGGAPNSVVRMDSLPSSITLAPHEAREITIPLHGTPESMRYDLGIVGVAGKDSFEVGFRTAQYAYLAPVHLFREPTVSIASVDVEIPNRLSVAYIRGAGDDADLALKGLGIPVYSLNTEGLLRFDLEGVSTVVIGPDAFRVDRNLATQMPRLAEFARKGGTVVVLSNSDAVMQPGILPFPVGYAAPYAEQVTAEDAAVVPVEPRARILTWPNVIRDGDWTAWAGARALAMPTTADARYARLLEMHDTGQKENRNTLLVATVGKGKIIYTSLTLTQQISNAVPGAMRVFLNLVSAGLPVEGKVR